MNTFLKAGLVCGLIPFVAACGGGGGTTQAANPGTPPVPAVPTVSFPSNSLIGSGPWTTNDLLNLAGTNDAFNQGLADGIIKVGVPSYANATYNGTIAFTAPTVQPKEFYGRMTMGVNFANNTLSGEATNFGLAKNTTGSVDPLSPLSGRMGFRRTTMTGSTFVTAMEGELGGVGGPYVIRSTLNGTVYTNGNTSLVQGTVTGDMSSDVIPVMAFSSGQFLATE